MFYFIFNLNFLCVLLRMFQWLLVGFPGSAVENLPAMQETRVQSLGWGDPLEKELATHSIFWPGKPGHRGAWWAAPPHAAPGAGSPPPPCPPSCGPNQPLPWALCCHLPDSLGGNLQIRARDRPLDPCGWGTTSQAERNLGGEACLPPGWVPTGTRLAGAGRWGGEGRGGQCTAWRRCSACLLLHLKVRAFVCIKCSNYLNWVFTLLI